MKSLKKALKRHKKVSEHHLQKVKRLEKALKENKKSLETQKCYNSFERVEKLGTALKFS